ncbi:MAG: histidine phosphatase family protein, partial [Phycisphaerae bacterium]|nr:histidine phosphatase family protein [Phycisphaerae bacterium]
PPVMPTSFYCGVDEASQQTTALFAARSDGGKTRELDDLAEANLGLWQGLTEDQLADRYPKVFSQWKNDPGAITPPQGEPLESIQGRLTSALGRLLKRDGPEPLALVLRPVLLAACHRWLAEEPLDWKTLHRSPPPFVQRFDLDGEKLRTVRAARRKKIGRPVMRSASA